MPNTDSHEEDLNLTNKFENLTTITTTHQESQPTSLEALTLTSQPRDSDLEIPVVVGDCPSREIHSDPEESKTKVKTRSRFSSAIRKLSRSTRKKEKPVIKSASLTSGYADSSQEPVVSSDADDLAETKSDSPKQQIKPKKKKKSIFSLKKSKVAPKKDILVEDTFANLEPLFQDRENEVIVTTERLSPTAGKSKVQITIKSKKIEKVATVEQIQDKTSSPSPPPPPPPQTLPATTSTTITSSSPTVQHTSTTTPSPPSRRLATNESVDKTKKLKTRIVTQTSQKSSRSTSNTTTTVTTNTTNTSPLLSKAKAEKDIVITQSVKDSPPREKAPAKPSRLASTAAGGSSSSHAASHASNSSSGALRKTATTTRAAVKLVSSAKAKAKTLASSSKASTSTTNKADKTVKGSAADTVATGEAKKDSELMINPQRGHRYPRPGLSTSESKEKSQDTQAKSSAPTTITTQSETSLPTTTNTTSHTSSNQQQQQQQEQQQQQQKQQQQQQQQQQQEQSPSQSTVKPQTIEIQSVSSVNANASLQSKPVRSISQTVLEELAINNSVSNQQLQQTDDHISLAESVHTSELSKNIDISYKPHEQQLTKDNSSNSVSPAVRFALGTRVRPPLIPKQLAYEPSSQEPYSIEQHSDDSDTPDSEVSHHRRKVHYISQPSLYDEFNSLEQKRTHYRYQSGVSDLSLDIDDKVEDTLVNIESAEQMPAFGDLTMDQEMEPTIMTSTNAEKREHLYKILVIGELGTGKTSFIKRYVHQFFSQNYRATIGVDFALKVLHWDPNTIVRLQLWDIAGQERFGNMTRVYYKEAVGAFIVFDVTRSGTFDCVSKWKEDLDSKVQLPDGSPIPCILLANKCDQDKQGAVTTSEKMDEYVKEHGFAGWFETSAKENINIDEAARALVNKILLNDKLISASDLADSERFNLDNTGDQTLSDAKNKCSC